MGTDLNPSSTAVEDRVTFGTDSAVLPRAEKTAAVTKVRYLERGLFDDGGRIRRGITPACAEETVALINELREALGWLEIDLDGRWRWPAGTGTASKSLQQVA
jgi:hypothetical protein